MRSPFRWIRRQLEISKVSGRRRELEKEISEFIKDQASLKPASSKGGYDEIFTAFKNSKPFAVVRLNSPFKKDIDPIGEKDPSVPLGNSERLEREWSAYEILSTKNLSPKPLWRTRDAIACSLIDGSRASVILAQQREDFWGLFERMLDAVRRMHGLGVVHLDLNTGNLLVNNSDQGIVVIDFEFGPRDWVNPEQQMAFDYLRLIDDCTKPRRGGKSMLSDLDRLTSLLQDYVSPTTGNAPMNFSLNKLHRLAKEPLLLKKLETVFPGVTR